jgi:plastocyanin
MDRISISVGNTYDIYFYEEKGFSMQNRVSNHSMRLDFRWFVPVSVLAILVFLAACSGEGMSPQPSGSTATSTPPTATPSHSQAAEFVEVKIIKGASGYEFSPSQVMVTKGGTVKWTNMSDVEHKISITQPNASVVLSFPVGKDGSLTLSTPGTYVYHCDIHPAMEMTIIVTE